MIKMHLNYKIL